MTSIISSLFSQVIDQIYTTVPRTGLHPIPGTIPLTFEAAICPPLVYYVALLFLPPPPPSEIHSITLKVLRNVLALIAGILFLRLPLTYHVPQSIGLTYQLGLVGLYGGLRVIDAFFISPYIFNHIPRRVKYRHDPRDEIPDTKNGSDEKHWSDGGVREPYILVGPKVLSGKPRKGSSNGTYMSTSTSTGSDTQVRRTSIAQGSRSIIRQTLSGPDPVAVYETALTEDGWPHTFLERASWALELELSMRGVGFTWTTADVRHTRKTWLPTIPNRLHSIAVHVLPVTLASWLTIKTIYVRYLLQDADTPWDAKNAYDLFDNRLPFPVQLILTAALGAFLMTAFSLGHSVFAIMLHPLAPSPLAFFPPLYTTPVWDITSVRKFWSFGWHRLFARLFLVYGVWPGQSIERKILGKTADSRAEIGKVIGGFLSSAFVHSFASRGVLKGDWRSASGEAVFFALNGAAVVFEEAIIRFVKARRGNAKRPVSMWYDQWFGRAWWVVVLLYTGRNFARGWVKSNLVREMAFM